MRCMPICEYTSKWWLWSTYVGGVCIMDIGTLCWWARGIEAGIEVAADELALEPGEYIDVEEPGDAMIRLMEWGECVVWAGIKCSSLQMLKQKKTSYIHDIIFK